MVQIIYINEKKNKNIQDQLNNLDHTRNPCCDTENISIFIRKSKIKRRKKYDVHIYKQQPAYKLTQKPFTKSSSLPGINKETLPTKNPITLKKYIKHNVIKCIADIVHKSDSSSSNFVSRSIINRMWLVYRCQLTSKEESCCCSCNSDTMFEVMKGLYDCYKKKNCDNCNCILCGHLQREERELGQLKKTLTEIGITAPTETEWAAKKEKLKKVLKDMEGKSGPEKEKMLKELAMSNMPLPEMKTKSGADLAKKVRKDLGLPPEPDDPAVKAKLRKAEKLGIGAIPLEGKSPQQKEKILRSLAEKGIPLPEGRTPSEKSLINKIKGSLGEPLKKIVSDKFRKAKTPQEKEKILRDMANQGMFLPEGKTPSEKDLILKVRAEMGLPPEPKTPSLKEKYKKAANDGVLLPLDSKTPIQKEKILQDLANRGIPLPEGRTPSEKALIAKIKSKPTPFEKHPSRVSPSEKIRKAKEAGFITPLQGKTPEQREKILKGLADMGIPFPEGKTASEKKIIAKVRTDLGLPPEPKTPSLKEKYNKAANEGILIPLEGKSPTEKGQILQNLADRGIPLPEGRTPSEKALIAKIKARPLKVVPSSEKMRKAKAAGLLTPLKGKTPEQKEKILRGLANMGLPLPEGKTSSEKKLLDKVRTELGLPPEPKTASLREKYDKAANEGVIIPLEGKPPAEKEKILQDLANRGIPLPEGRTASEKALIAKIKEKPLQSSRKTPSERKRKAKMAGLITPLKGKTPEQREKILKGLADMGLSLPDGETPSEKKIIAKVRADLGLPPEPKSPSMKEKYINASNDGILIPLEGKTPAEKENILRNLAARGIPLPEGRTSSEKALIGKIKSTGKPSSPSERLRKAKAEGLMTPLKGKSPENREKILKGLAMLGLPLPEGKTKSEQDLIAKIRLDLGLPPDPQTSEMKDKYNKAANDGLMLPLEGKSPAEKERILLDLAGRGIPFPTGRTTSEKSLILKIKAKLNLPSKLGSVQAKKLRDAKTAGLFTPLEGKTPLQKEKILRDMAKRGIFLPESKSPSDKKILDRVRADFGLPPEPDTQSMKQKHAKAQAVGILKPLEGKTPAEKEKILLGLANIGIPLPKGRTPSEKALIDAINKGRLRPSKGEPLETITEKMRKAKAAGLLTPLQGKTPEEKEKILKELADMGLPLPEGRSPSEKVLIDKIQKGRPPPSKGELLGTTMEKMRKAKAAGLLTPLQGKTPEQKEKIIKGLADMGLPLPEGRTPSEKTLINKIKKGHPPLPKGEPLGITTEKMRKAKAAGLLTPLQGKTPEQKEKILRGLAKAQFPLPEGKTQSEKALIRKIKSEYKIPEDTAAEKMRKAQAAGLVTPLTGKTPAQKEKILRGLAAAGLPLPEGKTQSEKSLIKKVKLDSGYITPTSSERIKKAQLAGLLTPLKGKSPEEKLKALKARLATGLPLPEGETPSEKAIIKKLTEGKTLSEKAKSAKLSSLPDFSQSRGPPPLPLLERQKLDAKTAKVMKEGKGPSQECICGLLTPHTEKGRASKLISRSGALIKKMKDAKAAGLLTPLEGKTPEQKEKILKGLAKAGLPLPEGKTSSEKYLINKVKKDLGLPPEPKSSSVKEKMRKAQEAGYITPLEGKSSSEKEKILKNLMAAGIPLPEGRTLSEKALINKVKGFKKPSEITPEKLRKAKAAGLLTPLAGKSSTDKEKVLQGLADLGLPLPEGTTPSEKEIVNKIIAEKKKARRATPSEKEVLRKAKAEGLLTPLSGKSPEDKEKILKGLAVAGLPFPEGKTPSEKALVKKIKAEAGRLSKSTTSEKKGKIKKSVTKGVGEEFEEITKTTKCDQACGCDKKKIKFKHSYVKIKVTSPDLSTICPCPDDCFPGPNIRPGVTTTNEGIKVTIASAIGIPTYTRQITKKLVFPKIKSKSLSNIVYNTYQRPRFTNIIASSHTNFPSYKIQKNKSVDYSINKFVKNLANYGSTYFLKRSISITKNYESLSSFYNDVILPFKNDERTENSEGFAISSQSPIDSCSTPISLTLISKNCSLSNTYQSSNVISLITDSPLKVSTSFSFSDFCGTNSTISSNEESVYFIPTLSPKSSLVCGSIPFTSICKDFIKQSRKMNNDSTKQNEFHILRVYDTKSIYKNSLKNVTSKSNPVLNGLENNKDIIQILNELFPERKFSDTSLFLIIPSSDDSIAERYADLNPTFYIIESKNDVKLKNSEETLLLMVKQPTNSKSQHSVQPDEVSALSRTDNNIKCYNNLSSIPTFQNLKQHKSTTVVKSYKNNITENKQPTTSIRKKKYKKKHITRKKLMDDAENSTSSDDDNTQENNLTSMFKKRSASLNRKAKVHLQKRQGYQSLKNNKLIKIQEPLQVQVLYKNVKRTYNKRCQVAVSKKSKNTMRAVTHTTEFKQDDKNLSDTVYSEVFGTINDGLEKRLLNEETNTKEFQCSSGWEEVNTNGGLESADIQFSLPCPTHGRDLSDAFISIENIDSNQSSITPSHYYSSDVTVASSLIKHDTDRKKQKVNALSATSSQRVLNRAASCRCKSTETKGAVDRIGRGARSDKRKQILADDRNSSSSKNEKGNEKRKDFVCECKHDKNKLSYGNRRIHNDYTGKRFVCECGGSHSSVTSDDRKQRGSSKEKKTKIDKGMSSKKTRTIWSDDKGETIQSNEKKSRAKFQDLNGKLSTKGRKTFAKCHCIPGWGQTNKAIDKITPDSISCKCGTNLQPYETSAHSNETSNTKGKVSHNSEIIESNKRSNIMGHKSVMKINNGCPCSDRKSTSQPTPDRSTAQLQSDSEATISARKSSCQMSEINIQSGTASNTSDNIADIETSDEVLMLGEYHDLEIVYIRDIMKMFSECSQTTSGFTLNMLKKLPETKATYKKALKDYREREKSCEIEYHPPHIPNVDCGCPYSTVDTEGVQDMSRGLKLAMGAKGHNSKGLAGILCFNIETASLSDKNRAESFHVIENSNLV